MGELETEATITSLQAELAGVRDALAEVKASKDNLRKLAWKFMAVAVIMGLLPLGWAWKMQGYIDTLEGKVDDSCAARYVARNYLREVNSLVFYIITTRRSDDPELVERTGALQDRAPKEFGDIQCDDPVTIPVTTGG